MAKYAIWDRTSNFITPSGTLLTPADVEDRYPASRFVTYVCAAGEINGAFFTPLNQMVAIYEEQGVDFSECDTNEDILTAIEAFEYAVNHPEDTGESTVEERIAAALEFQNILALDDENDDDPDEEE